MARQEKVCSYPGCVSRLGRYNKTGLCRSDFMRSLHEDEEWETGNRARSQARFKAMHCDPVYAARHSERMREVALRPESQSPERIKLRVEGFRRKFAEDKEFVARHAEKSRQKMLRYNSQVRELQAEVERLRALIPQGA